MNLYVGNLSAETTSEDLRNAFQAHGGVSSVTLLRDQMNDGRGTGSSRRYGFVVMPDKAQARAAQSALHRLELRGQPMTVQTARAVNLRRHRG